MVMKGSAEPLEVSDEAAIRNSSTPHRIKMPSIEEIHRGGKRPSKRKAAGATLTTVPRPNKFVVKTSTTRGRKPLSSNHKLTEYFPVRRSVRKCKKTVLEEKRRDLEHKVICGIEDGLQVKNFLGKGRGVVTTRNFAKGEFVVEYIGELIDQTTAREREAQYAKDQTAGCYMYYFQHKNQQFCVDATAESSRLGRLVNHSRNGNLVTRIVEIDFKPHLVLIAKEDIPAGIEVSYDYGDRSRESIRNHPWLAL